MGTYAKPSDIRKHFRKIDASGLTLANIKFYIDMAESDINTKLAVRYSLPFSSTPPLIKSLTIEMALLYIFDSFLLGEVAKFVTSRTDWREIRWKRVNKILDELAKGDRLLVDSDGTIISGREGAGTIESTTGDYISTFNMLDETIQRIDENRLDDEEDAIP